MNYEKHSSYVDWVVDPAERFHRELGINVVGPDFRFHGKSHRSARSFGCGESDDVIAAMNWAEENGFQRPYLLHGASLGGMAALIATFRDGRVYQDDLVAAIL